MKLLFKIIKYGFIMALVLFIIFFIIFLKYKNKYNYNIPNTLNIEIYDQNNEMYLKLNNSNRKNYINIESIDNKIIDAFISIEDKKFFTHKGVNFARIFGALLKNIKKGEIVEGASTITQQYAKLLFLSSDKNYKRKLEEILIAINLEAKYSKNEILEGYLNSIYFDHGIYGIEDACRFYFNKSASNVTLNEAVILASIPKGPIYYSPIKNKENNDKRKNIILQEMYSDKKITLEQMNKAKNEATTFYGKLDSIEDENAPYYQDIIIKELKKLNIDSNLFNNGIKVYTSLDLSLNNKILESINKYYPKDSNLEIAVYAMDPKTGKVLSVIGGKDYKASEYNRTLSNRQPGSTIKPFLYYAALENGFTPATTFSSSKTTFYIDGTSYSPNNYEDIYPNQEVSMAYALAVSDNIYAIKTHLFLGTSTLVSTLKDFGFTGKINDNYSLALGTSEVNLKELVTGYSKLASLGNDVEPVFIEKITDLTGKIIYENKLNFENKFNKSSCYILTETMTNVFDNNLSLVINTTGASIAAKLTRKYAAKSGSTDYDNWMIGYNSDIVLGIWTGYDDNSETKNYLTKYIKNVWADVMESYKPSSDSWYEKPDDVISIKLNPVTGTVAKKNEYAKDLYFKITALPWYINNYIYSSKKEKK